MTFKEIDVVYYIFYGGALSANIHGLALTYVLLKEDYKRNLWVVLANLCYLVCSILSFYQSSFDCATVSYIVKVLEILGTILQVLTPLFRAQKLMIKQLKVVCTILSIGLIVFTFLKLNNLNYQCDLPDKGLLILSDEVVAEVFSSVFSVLLYIISYMTILKVVYGSAFLKTNAKMQIIKKVSIYAMTFAVVAEISNTVLIMYKKDHTGLVLYLRSQIVLLLMVSQFSVELAKKMTKNSIQKPESNDVRL